MLDILKNIKTYFHILIVISATALALLLSPSENDYSSQLEELNVLQNISNADYVSFINSRIEKNYLLPQNDNFNDLCKFVQEVLTTGGYNQDYNFDNKSTLKEPYFDSREIIPMLSYYEIPRNESLSKWISWLTSKENATYLKPNWKTAARENNYGFGFTDFSNGSLRHFSLKNYREDISTKYRFRAFMDFKNVELDSADNDEDFKKYEKGNWWKVFDEIPLLLNLRIM